MQIARRFSPHLKQNSLKGKTQPALSRFAEVELEVETLAYGGKGVARHDGLVVFVESALPGDRVRAKVTKVRSGHAEAHTVELLAPGADRVADTCVHAQGPCPGAPWQGLPYELQLQHKAQQVDDALRRIGHLDGYELEPIVPAAQRWRYRNKLEYSFGEHDGCLVAGFHRRGDWRTIEDIEDCHLASESSNAVRNALRSWFAEADLPAYDRETNGGLLRNLVVREGRRTGQLQVRLLTSAAAAELDTAALATFVQATFPEVTSLIWSVNHALADVAHGTEDHLLAGESWIEEELAGLTFRILSDAFFQTNTEMAEHLVAVVREFIVGKAAGIKVPRLFDLYCGIGTIGLALAGQAEEIWGVDVVEKSIACAIDSARLNGVENAHFFAGNARTAIRPLIERAGTADVAVVDPPRAGLSQKVVRRVLESKAKRIVYVSCNPTTLAPNARQLVDAGYRLSRVRAVDMFPHTPHIECVALFEKS